MAIDEERIMAPTLTDTCEPRPIYPNPECQLGLRACGVHPWNTLSASIWVAAITVVPRVGFSLQSALVLEDEVHTPSPFYTGCLAEVQRRSELPEE